MSKWDKYLDYNFIFRFRDNIQDSQKTHITNKTNMP